MEARNVDRSLWVALCALDGHLEQKNRSEIWAGFADPKGNWASTFRSGSALRFCDPTCSSCSW